LALRKALKATLPDLEKGERLQLQKVITGLESSRGHARLLRALTSLSGKKLELRVVKPKKQGAPKR
jgi:hypothetical protein